MQYTDNIYINQIIDFCKDEYKEKIFNINFNIQQLYALNIMLGNHLRKYYLCDQNSGLGTTIYKSKSGKKKFYTYILENISQKNNILNFENQEIYNIFQKTIVVLIEVDIKTYKTINLKCLRINTKDQHTEEIIDKIFYKFIDNFFGKIGLDIENIIKNILNAKYVQSGGLTYLGMLNKELIGYYNTKYFELDAGDRCKYLSIVGKKIKIKYKFKNMKICNVYDDKTTDINLYEIYKNVIEKILELTMRTYFKNINNQKYFEFSSREGIYEFDFDKTILGEFCILEKDFEKAIVDFRNNEKEVVKIPKNIDKLLDNFFNLSNKEKEIFYNSCKSYEKALKTKSVERLFYLFQAIENIVAYEEKYTNNFVDKNRKNNIKLFLERYIKNRNFDDMTDLWYQVRSKYAHNAIDYNGIFDIIFREDLPMFKSFILKRWLKAENFLEVIVHVVLISWLEEK